MGNRLDLAFALAIGIFLGWCGYKMCGLVQ